MNFHKVNITTLQGHLKNTNFIMTLVYKSFKEFPLHLN